MKVKTIYYSNKPWVVATQKWITGIWPHIIWVEIWPDNEKKVLSRTKWAKESNAKVNNSYPPTFVVEFALRICTDNMIVGVLLTHGHLFFKIMTSIHLIYPYFCNRETFSWTETLSLLQGSFHCGLFRSKWQKVKREVGTREKLSGNCKPKSTWLMSLGYIPLSTDVLEM